ncbi:MAG: alpha/beta fold hydrolase [Candidatus Promineofilum sp.]|nr:alpha/beta fold hydrolase [Promineifilum sp.]
MRTFFARLKRVLPWLLLAGLALAALAAFGFWRATVPAAPSAFYTPPQPLPSGAPGTIIRSEPIAKNVPDGAQAWRVMYLSTGVEGQPVAVTGIVVAPIEADDGPRPVVAWAHGTLGVQPACGTGHLADPFAAIPEVDRLMREGFVLAATDYPGLGTPGVHPYLFGEVEAAAVLDSVRAAQHLAAGAGNRFAVWGHSQGGHAALWTAQTAADYAPELELVGAAAIAPAADLEGILESSLEKRAGAILISMSLYAWNENAPGASLSEILAPEALAQVTKLAGACVTTPAAFLLLGELRPPSTFLPDNLTDIPAFRDFIDANTPHDPIDVPLYIAHGTADMLIPFQGSVDEAARRCAAGEDVELERYPLADHNPVLEYSSVGVVGWIEDRFAERPSASNCG